MKISLICTVYNEGESIRDLLNSIVSQTRVPDEAVFVDAGSDDKTREIIEEYQEDHDWIRLIVDEGCNIAEGRNTAVENAEYDYIVGTDGGCIVDKEWCEAMEGAFQEGHEALSGLWKPHSENLFEFVQGIHKTGLERRRKISGTSLYWRRCKIQLGYEKSRL
ncbi:MAG: hypothetical protein BRC28_03210 [Nanohaloarchaea archaeon SW_4_43_9]|nr:MAG: hypothetical protein BRC28_03210 [Nanohaloarchaea archaeon SW_4_43_9]